MSFGPQDDEFHFDRMSDRWWETETAWFQFCVPERGLGGWLYTMVRPNIGTVAGGAWIWDDTAALPWEVLYSTNYTAQRLREGSRLTDVVLPNGVGIKMLDPLTRYALTYRDGDRLDLSLTFEAVMEPRPLRAHNSSFGSLNHFDQFGRLRGQIDLLGESIEVDCFGMRDRSWGPRPEHRPNRSSYVTGIASEQLAFLAVTNTDSNAETVAYGFFTRDGETHDLVGGTRKARYDPDHGWVTELEIEAEDTAGRSFHAVGRRISGIMINRHSFIDSNGLIEWQIDGVTAHGEDQDLWPVEQWADRRRSTRRG